MLKILAQTISVIFHPLLMLTYMLIILLVVNPFLFGYRNLKDADMIFIVVFATTVFAPMMIVLVMYLMRWFKSFQMRDKQERIAPYLVCGVFYLSLYLMVSGGNTYPLAFQICTLGVVIAIFVAFFVNNFSLVSIHAVGAGGLVSMVILTHMNFAYSSFDISLPGISTFVMHKDILLFISVIVAGMICSARLFLKAHKVSDVYGGFIIGFFSQLIAFLILQ